MALAPQSQVSSGQGSAGPGWQAHYRGWHLLMVWPVAAKASPKEQTPRPGTGWVASGSTKGTSMTA